MKRLLFIAHRVPYPPDKGERVRAFHQIKALAEHYRVTLVALAHNQADHQAAGPLGQWCERVLFASAGGPKGLLRGGLKLIKGRSVTEGYFYSRRLERIVRRLTARTTYDIAMGYSSGMLPYLLSLSAPVRVMDLVDVDSMKWFAYAEESGWPKSRLYQREGHTVRQLEEDAVIRCDAALVVSEAEARQLGYYPKKLKVLQNGVDLDFFSRAATPEAESAETLPSLVFTGTMDYRPNIEGVCWFVERVWPQLRQQRPELTFRIIGRDPAPAVSRLSRYPGIEVTGTVPDVRPYLAGATAAICPLRIARGVQNKILEAMAMSCAVVSSRPALEGIEATVDEDVLVADTPEQWRQQIERLLDDEPLRRKMGQQARRFVEEHHNWDKNMEPLVSLCQELAAEKAAVSETPAGAGPSKKRRPESLRAHKSAKPAINGVTAMLMWLMTFAYGVVLYSGCTMPSGKSLPFIGVWDMNLSGTAQDLLHMPAYAILMVCLSLALTASLRSKILAIILSVVISFGINVFFEQLQGSIPGRTVSNGDILLGSAGIMLALPAALTWRWPHYAAQEKKGRKIGDHD